MNIENIKKEIKKDLSSVKDLKSLNELHIKYLSKKVLLQSLIARLKIFLMIRKKSLVWVLIFKKLF